MNELKRSSLLVMFAFTGVLLLSSVEVRGQSKSSKSEKAEKIEEYLTIMVRHYDGKVSKMYITKSGGEYEEIVYDVNEQNQKHNLTPVIKLLEKYDKDGWKLEQTTMMHAGEPKQELFYTYYIFRRKRKAE